MGQQAAAGSGADHGRLRRSPSFNTTSIAWARRLAAKSERPDLPWSFKVVDDPVVNAFALPGGPIHVTRGLLAHMESRGAAGRGHGARDRPRHRPPLGQADEQGHVAQLGLVVGMAVSETVRRPGRAGHGRPAACCS